MAEKKKVLLSGIQASGRLHVGNYFGAMKQFVDYQDQYNSYIFVANFHALTTVKDAGQLREDTRNVVLDYMAVGLDPEKVTLYAQINVPEVAELTWYFNCLITVPWLMGAHSFKEKSDVFSKTATAKILADTDLNLKTRQKNLKIVSAGGLSAIVPPVNVGLLDYPVLMAADILIMHPDVVPVGEDQRQHVEMAREIAGKFNSIYGNYFAPPKELIKQEVAVVPGVDGRKMSKSYGNDIKLFASDDEIRKQCMSIVTDSKGKGEALDPTTDNVFALHKLFNPDSLGGLATKYKEGKIGYKE